MTREEAVASAAPPFAWMRILTVSMGWTTKSPTMPAIWPATACAHVGASSLAVELDGIAQMGSDAQHLFLLCRPRRICAPRRALSVEGCARPSRTIPRPRGLAR